MVFHHRVGCVYCGFRRQVSRFMKDSVDQGVCIAEFWQFNAIKRHILTSIQRIQCFQITSQSKADCGGRFFWMRGYCFQFDVSKFWAQRISSKFYPWHWSEQAKWEGRWNKRRKEAKTLDAVQESERKMEREHPVLANSRVRFRFSACKSSKSIFIVGVHWKAHQSGLRKPNLKKGSIFESDVAIPVICMENDDCSKKVWTWCERTLQ